MFVSGDDVSPKSGSQIIYIALETFLPVHLKLNIIPSWM